MRFIIAAAVLLLAACTATSFAPASNEAAEAEIEQIQAPLTTPVDQESFFEFGSLEKSPLSSQYQIAASLDYAGKHIWLEQQIDYLNSGNTNLDELLLIVEPQRLSQDFKLSRIASADGSPIENYEMAEGLLRIPLPEPLAPDERLNLYLSYNYSVPNRQAVLGCSELQCNFADWYAFFPPIDENGNWLSHPAAAVGEHLAYESADFRMAITILNDGDDILVAAPVAEEKFEKISIYQLANARRFAFSVSDQFELLESNAGEIPLRAYFFAGHERPAEAALGAMADSLAVFQDYFGAYPYPALSIVAADFPDGMESDGLFFLYHGFFEQYDGSPQNFLTTLSVHESAHNWWFGAVGSDQADEPWLDEALATYSELLYYERHHPELVDWWWDFRIRQYAPSGWIDSSIYDHQAFAPYVHAVYFRGAEFLHAVRQELGDEAFLDFLADYAGQFKGQQATGDHFLTLLTDYTDMDLDPLLEEYFQR